VIQLEKELLDVSEKTRRLEEEKMKCAGLLELAKESGRMQEEKLSYSNIEITKLNNAIKNLEKKESACRDSIDRLEGEIAQQRNKCEVLQSSLNSTLADSFEANIEKERLAG
jgi:predicted  nucleic acid-binding Zn-ribbon protein